MFLLILSLKWLAQKDFWTEAIWTSAWPDKCAISPQEVRHTVLTHLEHRPYVPLNLLLAQSAARWQWLRRPFILILIHFCRHTEAWRWSTKRSADTWGLVSHAKVRFQLSLLLSLANPICRSRWIFDCYDARGDFWQVGISSTSMYFTCIY